MAIGGGRGKQYGGNKRDTQSAVKRTWAKLLSAEFVIFKLARHRRESERERERKKEKGNSVCASYLILVSSSHSPCRSRGYGNVICIYSQPAAPPTPLTSVSR